MKTQVTHRQRTLDQNRYCVAQKREMESLLLMISSINFPAETEVMHTKVSMTVRYFEHSSAGQK